MTAPPMIEGHIVRTLSQSRGGWLLVCCCTWYARALGADLTTRQGNAAALAEAHLAEARREATG